MAAEYIFWILALGISLLIIQRSNFLGFGRRKLAKTDIPRIGPPPGEVGEDRGFVKNSVKYVLEGYEKVRFPVPSIPKLNTFADLKTVQRRSLQIMHARYGSHYHWTKVDG